MMNLRRQATNTLDNGLRQRVVYFLLFNIVFLVAYRAALIELFSLSLNNRLYSHALLIPFVSAYLIYKKRGTVFAHVRYSFPPSFVLIGLGVFFYIFGALQGIDLNQNDRLSVMVSSGVLFWVGGFMLFYGTDASKRAAFPLAFLIFMIPIPSIVLEEIVPILTKGSAEVVHGLFSILRVPTLRDGFTFHLPGLSIEVAEVCSGIRSTVALFITSVLVGYLFLGAWWNRVALTLAIFPISVFKNGLRIVTLSLFGLYVDEGILTRSPLHTQGGIPFFILALLLLLVILWGLRRIERKVQCARTNKVRSKKAVGTEQ